MAEEFKQKMMGVGLTDANFELLLEELIQSESTLINLEREHIFKLLPKMPIGQHDIVYKFWERRTRVCLFCWSRFYHPMNSLSFYII